MTAVSVIEHYSLCKKEQDWLAHERATICPGYRGTKNIKLKRKGDKMSFTQKDLIVAYHEEGMTYREIAGKVGVSEPFCRTVCSRANQRYKADTPPDGMCRYCGRQLFYTNGAKKKQFCSGNCRTAYHNQEKMRKSYIRTCEHCGKEFVSFGYPTKRFCSRECRTEAERRGREVCE